VPIARNCSSLYCARRFTDDKTDETILRWAEQEISRFEDATGVITLRPAEDETGADLQAWQIVLSRFVNHVEMGNKGGRGRGGWRPQRLNFASTPTKVRKLL